VFVNQSFGFDINLEIVKKFIEDTLNNPKLHPSLLEAAQDLKTKYYKDGQWSLTLWDIREDPFVRLFVEYFTGGLTTDNIDHFLSKHPNVNIFNAVGNGPNNQGTAQGGPPTVCSVSLIPESFLPHNRFFMVAVGDKKSYDNTAGSYLPRPGSPNRLPVVFQKPTNRTVQGPFYDEPSGRHYIFVDLNGDGHATTRLPVSAEDVKKFNSSGQSAESFFELGPDGSTSTATAQTTAQAAVAACRNPHEPVIRSLFDRIR
jgi:hypothetical protein